MKNIGIIAEYNPFHNGHSYQLQTIKKQFPDKKILVVMSGDFVQRGEPAIFNKYLRAECALLSGADILFELPPLFATASAEHFASAAALALTSTGVLDTLCFGAESDDIESFRRIAELLVNEPAGYRLLLKQHLKSGLSYPKARSLAVAAYLQNETYEEILKQPNNILGIEYMKAILKYNLALNPFIIKRQGSHYHDLTMQNPLSSASALRGVIENRYKTDYSHKRQYCLPSDLQNYMPPSAFRLLKDSEYAKPLFLSDFYHFLQYALWESDSLLEPYFEVTGEISNRISAFLQYPSDIDSFLDHLSGKNYTNARIKRTLLNILLKHTKNTMEQAKNAGYISYLRLLGFRSDASHILKEMKHTCEIPIINKVADAGKMLSEYNNTLFQKDIRISALYKQAFSNKYALSLPSEYEQSVILHN